MAIIAAATLTTVCNSCEGAGGRRATDGPLASDVGSGGNSLDPPPGRARWTGTFGGLLVCSENGASVEIESVSYHFVVQPVAIRPLIRQVPDLSERRGPSEKWAPLGTWVGTISELSGDEFLSASLEAPEGVVLRTPCDPGPDGAYAELVTSMRTDRRGGWIDEATIAYTSGGRDYDLTIPWTYITCGSAINAKWTDESLPRPC